MLRSAAADLVTELLSDTGKQFIFQLQVSTEQGLLDSGCLFKSPSPQHTTESEHFSKPLAL